MTSKKTEEELPEPVLGTGAQAEPKKKAPVHADKKKDDE